MPVNWRGKIAVCSRGTTSFYQKAEAAVANGAIATIIYNNQPGSISMDLTDYTQTAPLCLCDSGRRGYAEGGRYPSDRCGAVLCRQANREGGDWLPKSGRKSITP